MLHIPVMKNEVMNYMDVKKNGIYVDMTLGFGGHAWEILNRLDNSGHLYGIDQDGDAINYCRQDKRLADSPNLTILQMNFVDFKGWAFKKSLNKIDGFLFDLGISSHQIDSDKRGFSYSKNCVLDMRMDQSTKLTAKQLLKKLTYQQLVKIFKEYGQIKKPFLVAKAVVKNRGKINSTNDFLKIINENTPITVRYKKNVNKHIEKKYFLAIRIFLNNELKNLEKAVYDAACLLSKKGRMVVIGYHSLEIKCVKQALSSLVKSTTPHDLPINCDQPNFFWVTKKAVNPSLTEIKNNRRAHSAKLLCLERRG